MTPENPQYPEPKNAADFIGQQLNYIYERRNEATSPRESMLAWSLYLKMIGLDILLALSWPFNKIEKLINRKYERRNRDNH